MTVSELIEKLKELPSDLRVVVAGYEGGFNDIEKLEDKHLILDAHEEWFYGAHAKSETEEGVKAIVLLGRNHNDPDVHYNFDR